jgi:hypothetical protein
MDLLLALVADIAVAQVVSKDEDDVGLSRLRVSRDGEDKQDTKGDRSHDS